MIRYLLPLFLMGTLTSKAFSKQLDLCDKNPIFCRIVKNNPKIDLNYAMDLSDTIYNISLKYNIKSNKLIAIFAQESMYKLNAVNHKTKDYSIGQINIKTINRYKFDKDRLLYDLDYAVECSAKVLSDLKKRYSHREKDYWCRYNVGTGKQASIENKCKIYIDLVNRYL